MMHHIVIWGGFNLLVLLLLIFDLGVLHRKSHAVRIREALFMTAFYVVLGLCFAVVIYFWRGGDTMLEYLAGYVVEKSLSMDNVFVFLLIFTYFRVPGQYQHKILFWGILGALVMRAGFILAGITLIQKLHWVIYVFGAFLVYAGIKLALETKKEIHPDRNPILVLTRKFLPMTKNFHGDRFFLRRKGALLATPMFLVLIVVETTDVIFAVDSIPAILAVTQDPFIVYSSNVFAILGLRALYFALAGIMRLFHHLHYGLSLILVFVGVKMLLSDHFHIPIGITLAVIVGLLAGSILLSIAFPPGKDREGAASEH